MKHRLLNYICSITLLILTPLGQVFAFSHIQSPAQIQLLPAQNTNVYLVLPARDASEEEEIFHSMNDWLTYREAQGYTFHTLSLYEILDPTNSEKDTIEELTAEDIREAVRSTWGSSVSSNEENYLGLFSAVPDGIDKRSYLQSSSIGNSGDFDTLTYELTVENMFAENDFVSFFNFRYITIAFARDSLNIAEKRTHTAITVPYENIPDWDTSWDHIAIQVDIPNNTLTFYANGEFLAQVHIEDISTSGNLLDALGTYEFGVSVPSSSEGSNIAYRGRVDDIRISNTKKYAGSYTVPEAPLVVEDGETLFLWNDFNDPITDSGFDDLIFRAQYNVDNPDEQHKKYINVKGDFSIENDIVADPDRGSTLLIGEYFVPYEDQEFAGIPRFTEDTEWQNNIQTDLPYAYIQNEEFDINTASISNNDFTVFRVPATTRDNLEHMLNNAIQYEQSQHKKDVILSSGQYSFPGDTFAVQCVNEKKVASATRITHIADVNRNQRLCSTDYYIENENQRLATYLGNAAPDRYGKYYAGGVLFNTSHGSWKGIYAQSSDSREMLNFGVDDVNDIPAEAYSVYISVACSNDERGSEKNITLQLLEHNTAAAVTSSAEVGIDSAADVIIGQTAILPLFIDNPISIAEATQQLKEQYMRSSRENAEYMYANILSLNVSGDGLVQANQ